MNTPAVNPATRMLGVLAMACLVLLALGHRSASAQATEVQLTGDNANNFFIVTAKDATTLEFCTDLLGCFDRPRTQVQRIIIDGLDGDDGVFVQHGSTFVSNPDVPINLIFTGGAGSDELRVCGFQSCSTTQVTDVSALPDPDERRIVQCLTPGGFGEQCVDVPFQQPVPTLKINARGVDVFTDMSNGSLNVLGTPEGNAVSFDDGEIFTNTRSNIDEVTGAVSVDNQATYQFLNKHNLTLDTAAGPDSIALNSQAGFHAPASCARDRADVGAPVCVYAGEEVGDRLEVPNASTGEAVALTTRVSDAARLTGLAIPAAADIHGIDELVIPQAQSQLDSFTIFGTPIEDAFDIDASATDQITITGNVATNTPVPAPIPVISLMGDGTGPLAVTIDALGGTDVVTLTTGATDDAIVATPVPGSCFGPTGTCLRVATGTDDHSRITVGAERIDVATGDGTDTLRTVGDLAVDLRWAAGAGPDTLDFDGTGTPVTADLGAGTVAQANAAGMVTATEVENLDVDVADGNLTAVGTAGADTMRYVPIDATSATITLDGGSAALNGTGVGGTMTIDPAAGDDSVVIDATTTDDTVSINRGNFVTTQVGSTLPARASDATESVQINGRAGDDRFLLSGPISDTQTGGPTSIAIDGGLHTAGDRISFAAAISSAEVTFNAATESATLVADGPAIALRSMEHIDAEGDGAGTFTVNGSDAGDSIVQEGNTVTAGRGITASFTRYPTLVLNGLQGDDDVLVQPHTLTTDVAGIHVSGGDAGSDSLALLGSPLRETFTYTPDGATSGTLDSTLTAPVFTDGTEEILLHGVTTAPSGDNLKVFSPAITGTIEVRPGVATDEGTIDITDATGASSSFAPVHFAGLGRGNVMIDGQDSSTGPADAVRVIGQTGGDVFTLTGNAFGDSTVVMDNRIPVLSVNVHTVHLDGLAGQDTFKVPTWHGIVGAAGPAVVIDGGGPSGGDVANLTGSDQALVVDLAGRTITEVGQRPIAFSGLDRIDLDATGNATTFLGGSAPDDVTVSPTGPAGALITSDLVTTLVDLDDAGSLLIDTLDGGDSLTVRGSSIGETIAVTRGDVPRIAVGNLLPVEATSAVESITVDARDGADTLILDGVGGPPTLALDGGSPANDGDTLEIIASDVDVTFGDPATGGQIGTPGGSVSFEGVDTVDVTGDGSGALTVNGTDAPDTITLGDPGTPAVRVDDGAPVTFVGFPSMIIDGRGGADTIDVSYTNLGDLLDIVVQGGTSADDVIRIIDSLGTIRSWQVSPTDGDAASIIADGGAPSILATGQSLIHLDGRGLGDTVNVVTPDAAQDVIVTPGASDDHGTVRVGQLVPVLFTGIGLDGVLSLNDPAAAPQDHVIVEGGPAADMVRITGADRGVRLDGFVPVLADGAAALSFRGFDGDDSALLTGTLPWTSTTFEGGNGSDSVEIDGPAGDTVVDIGQELVTGYGGTLFIPEVEDLQTRHADGQLTLVGTGRDDGMCYDPLTPSDGRMHIIESPNGGLVTDSCQPAPGTLDVTHLFIDVGRLVVDPGAGSDQVLVNGTVQDDAVVIESTGPEVAVSVHPNPASTAEVRLAVNIITPTTENIIVSNDNGRDDIDVRLYEAAAPAFTIHGEAPDSRNADHLTVRDLAGGANVNDVKGDPQSSGTVTVEWRRFSGVQVDVHYTGFERVRTYKVQRPKDSSTTDDGGTAGNGNGNGNGGR